MTLRSLVSRYLPAWLSDAYPESPSYGDRWMWLTARFVDATLSVVMQGSLAAVGRGTPTALKYVGAARGVQRGRLDPDDTYRAKLPTWIDRWKEAGSQRRLAIEIAQYLGDSRVRVVNRHGHWITVEADGTITETDAPFDWDSVSHPARAASWSALWVMIWPTWDVRPGTLGDLTGDDGHSLGHLSTPQEVEAVKGLCLDFKSGHSCVRAIIWTSDETLFDPENPASLPNGRWGAWGILDGDSYVASDRNLTTCRYWEPR